MSDVFDLTGRTIAITGAGGVLCGGIAEHLAGRGATVAVLDLRIEAAEAVAGTITRGGRRALAVPANVLDRPSMEAALQVCEQAFGPVDALINGAGGNHPEATTSPELSTALRGELKAKAGDCGVKMIGLYSAMGNRPTAEAAFEFASDMGFEVIVGEPPADLFEYIDSLAEKHKVDFALHNHPKPSGFWNPETGLAAMKGRSERMGFCCDTGHWCRSGLEPVEMLKQIGSRVKTFHLKDLDQFGIPQAGDVVWGEGKGRIAEILAEVKRLGVQKPYFGIEWERTTNEPLETHARSVAFFEKVAASLVSP